VPSRARVRVGYVVGFRVGDELAEDGVGDPALETPDRLQGPLALGSFAPVVGLPVAGQADLADRGDVDHVVDPTVPGPGETVPVLLARGCI